MDPFSHKVAKLSLSKGLVLMTVTGSTFCCCSLLKHLDPPSSFSFSSRMKLSDGCRRRSSLAVARPTMPPPTTATSYVLKGRSKVRLHAVKK